jgi:hypothetical protein
VRKRERTWNRSEITFFNGDSIAPAVCNHVVSRAGEGQWIDIDPRESTLPETKRRSQHRRTGTDADIEQRVPGFGPHRGTDKHRIAGGPESFPWLPQRDLATEKRVVGDVGV